MRVKAQVKFTALKEEQIKFCISVSVINANRVFLYYEDGRPLPGGIRTLRCRVLIDPGNSEKGKVPSPRPLPFLFRCLETAAAV